MTILYESYSFESYVPRVARFQTETMLLTTIGKTFDGTWTSLEGKEVGTGSVVEIGGTLYDEAYNKLPGGKEIVIFHKLAAGAYAPEKTVKTDGNSNFKIYYKLDVDGAHRFRCSFEGDAEYSSSEGPEMVVYATSALPPYPDGINVGEVVAVGVAAAAVVTAIIVIARRLRR